MSKKLPKFLICSNPMVDNSLFILHSQKPKFIAQVIPTNHVELLDIQKIYDYGCQTKFNNQLFAIVIIEWLDTAYLQERQTVAGGLMSRMGDWFFNYLKFLKENGKNID